MRKLLVVCCLILACTASTAHPAIGIVKDSRGNIFYTDLRQVWKITPGGSKTMAVRGVHTHELYIDEQDNLFGEHLWYNGETKDTWGHYVWCLKSNGVLVKEIEPTEGFLTNYSFVRDSAGNMYWVERFTTSRIMKKDKTGGVTKLIEHKFGFIGWLFATKNGTLYFTESNKLRRLSPNGKLETVVENIGSRSTDFMIMGRNYESYGIWADDADNVYVAMLHAKKVIRISRDGKPETIFRSNSSWMITSGLIDQVGNLWVLENSPTNEVRIRKIERQNLATNDAGSSMMSKTHLTITIITMLAVVILYIITGVILNKRGNKTIQFSF
ncbi:MAG TPA: hypothetical protein VFP97_13125 [Chitinophagaceae bacterium]|nr:hypothetical protein [Chitinophagaceae bacterium]